MIIKFMPEDELIAMKSNLNAVATKFTETDNSWIKDLFDGNYPFKDTKFTIEDFALDMSQDDPFRTEFENVKRVYTRLKFLSDSQASDERLWAAMCLGEFYSYVQYRWNVKKNHKSSNIEQHFFFAGPHRRALTRNALARLWWIGRLTYNDKDGFALTEFVCRHADYISHILERNTSNNPTIVKAFLKAIMQAEVEGHKINTDTVAELAKYLNLLGGVYILDCLPYETIYKKIYDKAIEY
jgi:hypothetical protein